MGVCSELDPLDAFKELFHCVLRDCWLFDDLIRVYQDLRWNSKAELLRRLEVDDQLELGGRHLDQQTISCVRNTIE